MDMRCLVRGVCFVAYVINFAIADPIVKQEEKIYEKSLADHQAQTTGYSYSHESKSQAPDVYENQVHHTHPGKHEGYVGGHGTDVINGLGQVKDGVRVDDGNAGYSVGLGYGFSVSHGGKGHNDLNGHQYAGYALPKDKVNDQHSKVVNNKPDLYAGFYGLKNDVIGTNSVAYQPSGHNTVNGESSLDDRNASDHKDSANVSPTFADIQPGHFARYAISDDRADALPVLGDHIGSSIVNVQPVQGHYSSLPESSLNVKADYIEKLNEAYTVGKDGQISGNGGTNVAYATPGTIGNYKLGGIEQGSPLELSNLLKSIDLGKLGKSFVADIESYKNPAVSKVTALDGIETFKTPSLNKVEKPLTPTTFNIKVPNAPLLASFILPKIPAVGSVEKDKAPLLIHVPSPEVSAGPAHYDVKEEQEPEAGSEAYQKEPATQEETVVDSNHENLEAPEQGDYQVEHISYSIGDDGHSGQYSDGSQDDDGGYGHDKDFGIYGGEFLKDYGDHNGHDSTDHGDYNFGSYGGHGGKSRYHSDYGQYVGHSGSHGKSGNGDHDGGDHHPGHYGHGHHSHGDHGGGGHHHSHDTHGVHGKGGRHHGRYGHGHHGHGDHGGGGHHHSHDTHVVHDGAGRHHGHYGHGHHGHADHGGGGHHHSHDTHGVHGGGDHYHDHYGHGHHSHGDHDDHSDHHQANGNDHHDDHYYSHGSKGDKGHRNQHSFDKDDHGHHDSDHYRDFFKEHGGHEKSHLDEASLHGYHHMLGKGEKDSHFGGKKGHKKGSTSTGYHNVEKKDEYTKEHTFYDNAHRGGHYTKGGDHDIHFHENDDHHKEGSNRDSSYEDDHFGKKDHTDKGYGISDDIGHDRQEGHHSHHDKYTDYGDKGAKSHGTYHSISSGDHDDHSEHH